MVTCVPCKLLERIVASKVYSHLDSNNVLSGDQHGFVHDPSTCTNLLECLNDFTNHMQDKCQTIVIYIDFSKAFDVVPHDKLFSKLYAYGIRGTVLQWIKNLFTGRTFCTRIKLFADDVKLYVKIVNKVDCDKLHQALSALYAWTADWQLGVSIDKCCVMCIGKGEITDQFHIDGIQLPAVSSCLDLGITIRNSLSPSDHITDIVVRAHRRANLIHRCFIS